jgi:hypothetical protein
MRRPTASPALRVFSIIAPRCRRVVRAVDPHDIGATPRDLSI